MEYMRAVRVIREQKRWDRILRDRFEEPLVGCVKDAATLAREIQPLLEELVE